MDSISTPQRHSAIAENDKLRGAVDRELISSERFVAREITAGNVGQIIPHVNEIPGLIVPLF